MAEFQEPLLNFENTLLDINENPSNVGSPLIHLHVHESVATTEITKCDLTFTETLESTSNDVIELSKSDDNAFNSLFLTSDEFNAQSSFTVQDALNSTMVLDTGSEVSENALPVCPDKFDSTFEIVDEHNINNRQSDSGIHDSENNIVLENTRDGNLQESQMQNVASVELNISDDCGTLMTDFNNELNDVQVSKDEEFHDAVQFFKDPSSLAILESAGTSNTPAEPLLTRSSLYKSFDPLHAKFFSHSAKSAELQGITEDEVEEPDDCKEKVNTPSKSEIINNVAPKESIGNVLMSFDSPIIAIKETYCAQQLIEDVHEEQLEKLYTEEELQQALKIKELSVQEAFLKRQQDIETTKSEREQELEEKLKKQIQISKSLYCVLEETMSAVVHLADEKKLMSEEKKQLIEKLEAAEKEIEKLKEDLKTSGEDLQSVENTFSDFHKRYEQSKSMLKMYTQNESNFKLQISNMKAQLEEKDEMYKALQVRTEEMLDKANAEVAIARKAGDSQGTVLKAQLQKAELKISSLESDVKHLKIENDKLSSICDDLMAKVSES